MDKMGENHLLATERNRVNMKPCFWQKKQDSPLLPSIAHTALRHKTWKTEQESATEAWEAAEDRERGKVNCHTHSLDGQLLQQPSNSL